MGKTCSIYAETKSAYSNSDRETSWEQESPGYEKRKNVFSWNRVQRWRLDWNELVYGPVAGSSEGGNEDLCSMKAEN